jgi:hypothetical protein
MANLDTQVADALAKSAEALFQLSQTGGYAGTYKSDGTRFGESSSQKLEADQIWVQPPGTPAVGDSFLRSYELTGNQKFLDYAIAAGQSLAHAQLASGGWSYVGDGDAPYGSMTTPYATLDDNTTQGALNFLMHLDEFVDQPWLSGAVQKGLSFLVTNQADNGGWQQSYGASMPAYRALYTFNDAAMNDTIDLMFRAYSQYGDPAYLNAAVKGADFILATQGKGDQPGWAAQYDKALNPAPARSFEPAALDASVTADNVQSLIQAYLVTGQQKYLDAAGPALDWLEKSKLGDDFYARFYEYGTNKPIYETRDGKIYYDWASFPSSDKGHYAWQDDFNVAEAKATYGLVKQLGRDGYLAKHPLFENTDITNPLYESKTTGASLSSLESSATKSLSNLSADGYWKNGSEITTKDFFKNTTALQNYLDAVNGPDDPAPVPPPQTPGSTTGSSGGSTTGTPTPPTGTGSGTGSSATPPPDPKPPSDAPGGFEGTPTTVLPDSGNGHDLFTGGSQADLVNGGAGRDTLIGASGDDSLGGGAGDDSLLGGDGADHLRGDKGADVLDGGAGADVLEGGSSKDILLGGDGNDTLDGGASEDQMSGGKGDDVYVVDRATDVVTENASEGQDLVRSTSDYTLGANVENLTIISSANRDGTGNELANRIEGGAGKNVLSGLDGDDTLIGGAGNDQLIGGAGADSFVYQKGGAGVGADTILDFGTGKDAIRLQGYTQSEVQVTDTADGMLIQLPDGSILLKSFHSPSTGDWLFTS